MEAVGATPPPPSSQAARAVCKGAGGQDAGGDGGFLSAHLAGLTGTAPSLGITESVAAPNSKQPGPWAHVAKAQARQLIPWEIIAVDSRDLTPRGRSRATRGQGSRGRDLELETQRDGPATSRGHVGQSRQ